MIYITKGIYFIFYSRRGCYLYILQDLCFYFAKNEILLLLFVQLCKSPGKSLNFVESLGKVLELRCKKFWKKWKKILGSPEIWIILFGGNCLVSVKGYCSGSCFKDNHFLSKAQRCKYISMLTFLQNFRQRTFCL